MMSKKQTQVTKKSVNKRKKPGEGGSGEFFRVVVRPKNQFITFRYHDVVDIPESEKPTRAQKKARSENIKKAQESRKS